MQNPNGPATRRQTWAIFCATKKDVRNAGLTKQQASDIIGALKEGKEVQFPNGDIVRGQKYTSNENASNGFNAVKIHQEAHKAGLKAMEEAAKPVPMVVQQHENMADDNSPVVQEWVVPGGPCGFAWVNVKWKGNGRKFINQLKRKKMATADINSFAGEVYKKDSYYGGYTYWVHEGNQSIYYKEKYAAGYVEVLQKYDIPCTFNSRLD